MLQSTLSEKTARLTSLMETSKLLSSSLDLKKLLTNLLLTSMGNLMITRGAIIIRNRYNKLVPIQTKGLAKTLNFEISYRESRFPKSNEKVTELPDSLLKKQLLKAKLIYIIPITVENKIFGYLCLGSKALDNIVSKEDFEFLNTLVNIYALSIVNAINYQELEDLNRELEKKHRDLNTLFEISRGLNATLDEENILKILTFSVMGQFLINQCLIYMKKNNSFELAMNKGYSQEQIQNFQNIPKDVHDFFLKLSKPVIIKNTQKSDKLKIPALLRQSPFNVAVPIIAHHHIQGAILLGPKSINEEYEKEELEFLQTVINNSFLAIENARNFKNAIEMERLEKEISIAKKIQEGLFPKKTPDFKVLDISARSLSSREVGGDYYDIIELKNGKIGVTIADVSGKGIPAALLMSNFQSILRLLFPLYSSLSKIFQLANEMICENTTASVFITCFGAIYSPDTREITYCNAGHPPPLFFLHDGKIKKLNRGGIPLGLLKDVDYPCEDIILDCDDLIVAYTDGFSEAKNAGGQEFEEQGIMNAVIEIRNRTAHEIRDHIYETIKNFSGLEDSREDDQTLLVLKCCL